MDQQAYDINQGSSSDAIIGTAQSGAPDTLEITETMSNKSEHNTLGKKEMSIERFLAMLHAENSKQRIASLQRQPERDALERQEHKNGALNEMMEVESKPKVEAESSLVTTVDEVNRHIEEINSQKILDRIHPDFIEMIELQIKLTTRVMGVFESQLAHARQNAKIKCVASETDIATATINNAIENLNSFALLDDGEIEKLKSEVYKINSERGQFVVEDADQFKMVKDARETVEQYKERKLNEMREAGELIKSNPNMRRNVRGSNAPDPTASDDLRKYTANRMKNNASAKKSRDNRRLLEILNGWAVEYYREDTGARQNEMRDVDAMIREKRLELILKAALKNMRLPNAESKM